MPTSTLAHLLPLLDTLSPQDIIKVQEALTRLRETSEALCLIETAKAPVCPACGSGEHQRWGRTRVGLQRYRCACERTYTSQSNTPLAGFKHLPKVLTLLGDMLVQRDGSCRTAAARLGVERMTVWRWGLGRWHVPLLGLTARGGGSDLMPMSNTSASTISGLMAGRLAPDVALHTDGSLAMETYAKRAGFAHTACVRGYRPTKGQSAHLNTVNVLHALWRHFVARSRGPATKYLVLYVKWFVALRNGRFTDKEIFQAMSVASVVTNME